MQHFVRLHAPHIVAIEQPVELLDGERQYILLDMPRPVKTMPLQTLLPVFIVHLFRLNVKTLTRESS
jgi:hypothetical protein